MNHCVMQQNAFAASGDVLIAGDRKPPVLCPKPRRIVPRALRWQSSHHAQPYDSDPRVEFLDFFLSKGGESLSMSPPFCGSPPTRAANPVVRDARFGEDRPVGPLPLPATVAGGSPMSPRGNGACSRTKFGLKPAAVRIEGFDCLDRGRRRGCSITAVA
ncbi:hypothetical protein AXF42_Ash005420 [Apostasia shenzhenica]|uniref:Uncharacterized protein n=1 Tax=Apostasia shenzhenica TaxID=1088818 RepID=A0A2I0B6W2_9ASPA|nr:hypothetical protein AXF42_Ash005420 [Apostasia shenzhenica]